MKSKIDELFDRLLEEVSSGRDREESLKEYREDAEELRPLLRLAREIYDLPAPEPDSAAVEHTVKKVRERVLALESKRRFLGRLFSLHPGLVRAIAAAVLLVVIGWTTVVLSASSLPGDLLYPVKCLCERIEFIVTTSPEGKAELHLRCAGRRTDEFVLTFKEGEKINAEVLNAMLREKRLALECSALLDHACCKKMAPKMKRCNEYQMAVLENVKRVAAACDTQMINEAIDSCIDCDRCIERVLQPTE